jgi:two-component system sensor histidine kinase/response regulator
MNINTNGKLRPAAMAAGANMTRSRLMVVADHEQNLRTVGAILRRLDFDIVPVRSGAEALDRMATCRPELVLIGLSRPDVDGFQLCRQIRANQDWAGIPVLIYSLAGDKSLTGRAFENGAADCITGPFYPAELISRVRAQLSFKATRDELKQLAEDKEESLGILVHDLKNHLVGMHLGADLLGEDAGMRGNPRARLVLENISRSSSHMLSFVNRFLENASTGGSINIKLEPVSFSEAASRSVRQFQEVARRKRLVVRLSLPRVCPLVQADPDALNQVLDNVLSNAVKFSPLGKQVSVVVRPATRYVECRVQDQGFGFTKDDMARMFSRYGRLSARPTGGESSAGLGLSIVKKLMEAMCGEVACQSTAGSGARFSLRLPRAAAQC